MKPTNNLSRPQGSEASAPAPQESSLCPYISMARLGGGLLSHSDGMVPGEIPGRDPSGPFETPHCAPLFHATQGRRVEQVEFSAAAVFWASVVGAVLLLVALIVG